MSRAIIAAVSLVLSAVVACQAAAPAVSVFGGATSSAQLEKLVIGNYSKASAIGPYLSIGSGAGITKFSSKGLLIAASDDPMTANEEAQSPKKFTLPQLLSSYSFFVNGVNGVSLSATQLISVYTGKTTKWSDLKLSFPKGTIIPIARGDASGTTAIITRWFSIRDKNFPLSMVGFGPYKFGNPNQVSAVGSAGVIVSLAKSPAAIGYAQVGLGIGSTSNYLVAVDNAAGEYIRATQSVLLQAIPRTLPPSSSSWAGVSLINTRGTGTYPLASMIYLFARQDYQGTGKLVAPFLTYVMSKAAQAQAYAFYSVPIPSNLVNQNLAAINMIKP